MKEDEAALLIEELGLAFPKTRPLGSLDSAVALWIRDFGRVPYEDMARAVSEWVETKDAFPTLNQLRQVLKKITAAHMPEGECRCDGSGWYEATKRQWIPCPGCLPATFARWQGGHFAKGHHCPECDRVARNDGPVQPVDERSLTPRPAGRPLTREENMERLTAIRQVVAEIGNARKGDLRRSEHMARADIDRHWEARLNEIVQESFDGPEEVQMAFNEEPQMVEGHEVL